MTTEIENEFSRILQTHGLGIAEKPLAYEATRNECQKIADRFKILAIKSFKITGAIQKLPDGFFQLKAALKAEVLQNDIATNEEFPQSIAENIVLVLAPKSSVPKEEDLEVNEDAVETIPLGRDGSIDIGEIFVQYLSLSIDPYPSKS